jgi:hypothetical protein
VPSAFGAPATDAVTVTAGKTKCLGAVSKIVLCAFSASS